MFTASLSRRLTLLVAASFVSTAASAARAETIYGLTFTSETEPQTLVRFDSAAPGAVTTIGAFTGLPAGSTALAIDFRPATGQLYLGASRFLPGSTTEAEAGIYTVNLSTAAVTPVGATFDPIALGVGLPSFDFDPVRDQLRVLTTPTPGVTVTNTRFDPNNNLLISTDTNLAFAPGDRNAGFNPPTVIGAAYSNNVAGATSTTLYAYEIQTDNFVTVGGVGGSPSPDGGQLSSIGPSGFVVPGSADAFGFDISGPSGIAYVSSFTEELSGVHLFTVGLTGQMTDVGAVGTPAGTVLLDISVDVPEPASLGLAMIGFLGLLRRRRTE